MRFYFQILFFLLTWIINQVNAIPAFEKFVLPENAITISKSENVKVVHEVKIGVVNFARSGIEEDYSSLKNTSWDSYALEYSTSEENIKVVTGAGKVGLLSKISSHTNPH